jgi:subtilase family serine protease
LEIYSMRYVVPRTLFSILILALFALDPVSALYCEEGLPLTTVAQGMVRGEVMVNGTYGLAVPPVEYTFSLPGEPAWSRIYAGVWGGTEHYTGWIEFEVNGKKQERITLYGTDDRNPGVYAASHGVYWISADGTGLLHPGENTVIVRTSRGEEGSKLDGRLYAVQVTCVVENEQGPLSQYWIAEGNENLHGEGWAGTNPTMKDQAGIVFSGARPALTRTADLAVLLLASNRGQPDYLLMNGKELGISPDDTSLYAPGAKDIGDEISFDAEGGPGMQSRYVDMEHFNVGSVLSAGNTVTFLRGKDQNGDGLLSTSGTPTEAEDYIHPVFAALVAELDSNITPDDLAVSDIDVAGAYAGGTGKVTVTVISNGIPPSSPAVLVLESDGEQVGSEKVVMDYSGKVILTFPWVPGPGTHTLTARIDSPGDTRPENNVLSREITAGDAPDLSVATGAPIRQGSAAPAPTSAPLSLLPALLGPLGGILIFLNRRRTCVQACAAIMLTMILVCSVPAIVPPVSADKQAYRYEIPVEIKNQGGSDSGACDLAIWLDGEKVVVHHIDQGIPAGGSISIPVPVTTTSGMHRVRVVVDPEETTTDKDRSNNQVEGMYEFP